LRFCGAEGRYGIDLGRRLGLRQGILGVPHSVIVTQPAAVYIRAEGGEGGGVIERRKTEVILSSPFSQQCRRPDHARTFNSCQLQVRTSAHQGERLPAAKWA